MSPRKFDNLGPGSLESITVFVRGAYETREARATGTYTVYCGHGWDHEVSIDSDWYAIPGLNVYGAAHMIIGEELTGWSDPCDDGCACGPSYELDHVQCHKSPYCDGCDGHPFECA